ncbi:MAG TPA: hypothetical protein VFP20_00190 [Bacteroidales bacterium]|nr:hypothetical protein [Bacteroidales bacterium]
MKNKSIFGLLINPFVRIAGWQAFGLGLVFVLLMGFIGASNGIAFDGVFDMHLFETTVQQSFAYLAIDLGSLVLTMWIIGLIVSKNVRFIDILGTMTLARAPFLLLALMGYFTTAPNMSEIMKNPYVILQSTSFLMMIVLTVPIMVWCITLMYKALKVSCDLKGSTLTASFIIGLFVSEIIAKILIHYFV